MAVRTVVIANPHAKSGWLKKRWPTVEPILRRTLGALEVRFTEQSGAGRTLARAAAAEGAQLVIAIGGDGTASEVAGGLLEHQEQSASSEPSVGFGYIPCATGGDLRRTLGISKDIEEAVEAIQRPPGRVIDAGGLEHTGHDGRPGRSYFINIASAGIGGGVDEIVNQGGKPLGGTLAFFMASVRATFRYKNTPVRIKLDDQPAYEETIQLLAVCNGAYFGGGMHAAPDAKIDDGRFDVLSFGDFSLLEGLSIGLPLYQGKHLDRKKVKLTQARVVRAEPIEPEAKVLLDVDGETPGRLPATWTLLPSSILWRG